MLQQYFEDLFITGKKGDAREESYYPDLKKLLETWGEKHKKKIHATSLPKKTEAGNPDFRVWDKDEVVGFIEAKEPKVENLEPVESSEQLKRYRDTFPNLILTNFFEWRLYRHGELVNKVVTGRAFVHHKLKTVPPLEHEDDFLKLLEQFFAFATPKTTTAKQLATELAKRTKFLRDQVIKEELQEENQEGVQTLEAYYNAFKKHLIASLTREEFSDLFSQTITYGLFAARSRSNNGFNRKLAYDLIPHTIGILRDVFSFISNSPALPENMEWIIDEIAKVLAASDVNKIMENFYKEGKGRDPIIHFYETFLKEYDPATREKRGVYYTPEPVVGYIVRSIHKLLKEKFDKEDGFATASVTVLDPAAGTLTFPAEAIRLAVEEYKGKYGAGGIKSLVKDHILKDFYAFELMMAPYAVGHLKIGFTLDEAGYKLSGKERFNLYLTNTLDFTSEDPNTLPGVFERTIAQESKDALKIKEEVPVMVVMGNPPYSGVSENKGDWILEQIEEYKKVDGEPLNERKHWLQDDYVKFFRFAQWKIEQSGQGILGFITNHAWLDNPTFRGMRNSMLRTFDELYIVNLHGSTLKKEKTPTGGKDENVFDIQTGVAIAILVKHKENKAKKIVYADRWGLREEKYNWLDKNDIESTKWNKLEPNKPYYFLIPQSNEGRSEYEQFIKVTDIFSVNSTGVLTGRDDFVIDFDQQPLETRIRIFRDSKDSDDFIKEAYKLKDKPAYRWFVSGARQKLRDTKDWEQCFKKINFRPFDQRSIYYDSSLIFWPREGVMRHMILVPGNLAFVTHRTILGNSWNHVFVGNCIVDVNYVDSAKSANVFPLYSEKSSQQSIFGGQEKLDLEGMQHSLRTKKEKEPNIAPKIFEALKKAYGQKPSPEDIFYYIYGVLYSNTYREKYKEFLKIDFPRVPFTADYKLFQKIGELGEQLVDLHLLKPKTIGASIAKFNGQNGNKVEKPRYEEKQKRVYINAGQYFEGVEPEAWDYHIGGYQVLHKWLKDRKGRSLAAEDVKHYCHIVTALAKTMAVQREIDGLYAKVEKIGKAY